MMDGDGTDSEHTCELSTCAGYPFEPNRFSAVTRANEARRLQIGGK